jgi:hypothetical protein
MVVLKAARANGIRRIAILGMSDLAEIAAICALDCGISIVAVIDAQSELPSFIGVPVKRSLDDIGDDADAVLVTDMKDTFGAIDAATRRFGAERVLVPALLDVRGPGRGGTA